MLYLSLLIDQFLEAWTIQDDGSKYGARVERSSNHSGKYGMEGHFIGKGGESKFSIWNSGTGNLENPQIVTINPKQKITS